MSRDYDRDDRDDDREYDRPDPRAVARKVKPPAIALLVIGIISLLFVAWGTYQYFFTFEKEFGEQRDMAVREEMRLNEDVNNPRRLKETREMYDTIFQVLKVAMPITYALQGILALLTVIGSIQVLRMKSRGWGVTAAVAAVIPHLGCLVWVFSLAFGIWALMALNNRVVKRAFAADREGDRDDRHPDDHG